MTILVTGATGFLGGRLARRLHREGRPVLATGRDGPALARLAEEGIATARADLSHEGLPGVTPTAIIHCAALSSPSGPAPAFSAANVATVRRLLDLARRAGNRRFVQVSTPAVYWRPSDQIGLSESAPLPPPVNHYAATKRRAERMVLAAPELGPVVLRPRAIYGRGDTALLPRLAAAAARGPLPLFRDGRAVTDLTHVEDVVDACIAALDVAAEDLPEVPVFNVSGGAAQPLREVIERVCAHRNLPLRWRPVPVPVAMAVARASAAVAALTGHRREPAATRYAVGVLAYSQTLDISRARNHLGWSPRISFEEGFREAMSDG
ncbi:NAD-dependent epimerase/dehydratase family protein [Roseisalinus antarcticus]|uniref:dTDP-glucose 4,6-dehydratase n=1 Tax=Roseisalinus antarcticus TaxID=254357 RepID=A0A1Y5SCG2_9RHOB|nr:NAD(P)-dependent oxidoreductase [Roseisalinus antarcticus]SLN37625.1 dTDP-glucose 4,6-dehydratase [Roseisalinus antarcticus]